MPKNSTSSQVATQIKLIHLFICNKQANELLEPIESMWSVHAATEKGTVKHIWRREKNRLFDVFLTSGEEPIGFVIV